MLYADFWRNCDSLPSLFEKVIVGIIALGISLGWLFGFYHLGLVCFSVTVRAGHAVTLGSSAPGNSCARIAILHTVCDDFQHGAAFSCVTQDYPNFHVYVLDDSVEEETRSRVDRFACEFPKLVTVLRRDGRKGFKAGNLNNCILNLNDYKYAALADSDTRLPARFLKATSQVLGASPWAAFVQAVHFSNDTGSGVGMDLGAIVQIGWKYYQPVRNQYGFPMCYGHGALLRVSGLRAIGGFPEIVSEDIALTLRLRGSGLCGITTSEVVCGEDYPRDYHTLRKRHSRWLSADLECFRMEVWPFLGKKNVGLVEKVDAVLRGLKYPLGAVCLPLVLLLGLTLFFCEGLQAVFARPVIFITVVMSLSPYIPFALELAGDPGRLLRTVSRLTAVYWSNSFLITFRTLEALLLRKAEFRVTGARRKMSSPSRGRLWRIGSIDEAGYPALGVFEAVTALLLGALGLGNGDGVSLGLGAALALGPLIMWYGWDHSVARVLMHAPLAVVATSSLLFLISGSGSAASLLVLASLPILLF
jgi:hypothetical protein